MARFGTVKDSLSTYLRDFTIESGVWYQPLYRNVCAFAREHLLVISFEIHDAWFDEPEYVRNELVENRVYERLMGVEDPLREILRWTPSGLRVQPKVLPR